MSLPTPARVALTVLMDALVVVAVFLIAAVVVSFFGVLASTPVGSGVLRIAKYITLPLGVAPIATPYSGEFLPDATLTALLALLAEWLLSGARRQL